MKIKFTVCALINCVLVSFIANSFGFIKATPQSLFVIVTVFILINIFAGAFIAYRLCL